MKNGFVLTGTVASVVGAIAWLMPARSDVAGAVQVLSSDASVEQSREGGSQVPCAVPLRWRVTRVDRPFGVDEEDATARILEGASLWNDVVGTPLFLHDPQDGFPIRLVFDERQERTQERVRQERALDATADRLDVERQDLNRENARWVVAQTAYEEAGGSYERAIAEHNATVREWNERGGAPEAVANELAARDRALSARRQELEEQRRSLDAEATSLRQAGARFNERAQEHRRRSEDLVRAFPPTTVQSGEYREAVRRENGRLVSVSREIRIYRFTDNDELRLVAAHELGHALGLGHSAAADAVMSEQHTRAESGVGRGALHADDVEQLRARCPDLGPPAP